MSALERQAPLWVIECNQRRCVRIFVPARRFDQRNARLARCAAATEGWQVRPHSGRGSMSAPDFCPEHRTDGGEQR